ncbi:MAG: hypothetical protein U5J64_06815 [Halobacteriales archaeon]|nr:hypothetical protein [Halobacteriales archaeon]
MEVVSKSNTHWIIAHEDELKSLPDDEFKYAEIDMDYSLFRQAIYRSIIEEVGEASDSVKLWELKKGVDDMIVRELEEDDGNE